MVQYFDSLKKLFVISTAFDEIAFVVNKANTYKSRARLTDKE